MALQELHKKFNTVDQHLEELKAGLGVITLPPGAQTLDLKLKTSVIKVAELGEHVKKNVDPAIKEYDSKYLQNLDKQAKAYVKSSDPTIASLGKAATIFIKNNDYADAELAVRAGETLQKIKQGKYEKETWAVNFTAFATAFSENFKTEMAAGKLKALDGNTRQEATDVIIAGNAILARENTIKDLTKKAERYQPDIQKFIKETVAQIHDLYAAGKTEQADQALKLVVGYEKDTLGFRLKLNKELPTEAAAIKKDDGKLEMEQAINLTIAGNGEKANAALQQSLERFGNAYEKYNASKTGEVVAKNRSYWAKERDTLEKEYALKKDETLKPVLDNLKGLVRVYDVAAAKLKDGDIKAAQQAINNSRPLADKTLKQLTELNVQRQLSGIDVMVALNNGEIKQLSEHIKDQAEAKSAYGQQATLVTETLQKLYGDIERVGSKLYKLKRELEGSKTKLASFKEKQEQGKLNEKQTLEMTSIYATLENKQNEYRQLAEEHGKMIRKVRTASHVINDIVKESQYGEILKGSKGAQTLFAPEEAAKIKPLLVKTLNSIMAEGAESEAARTAYGNAMDIKTKLISSLRLQGHGMSLQEIIETAKVDRTREMDHFLAGSMAVYDQTAKNGGYDKHVSGLNQSLAGIENIVRSHVEYSALADSLFDGMVNEQGRALNKSKTIVTTYLDAVNGKTGIGAQQEKALAQFQNDVRKADDEITSNFKTSGRIKMVGTFIASMFVWEVMAADVAMSAMEEQHLAGEVTAKTLLFATATLLAGKNTKILNETFKGVEAALGTSYKLTEKAVHATLIYTIAKDTAEQAPELLHRGDMFELVFSTAQASAPLLFGALHGSKAVIRYERFKAGEKDITKDWKFGKPPEEKIPNFQEERTRYEQGPRPTETAPRTLAGSMRLLVSSEEGSFNPFFWKKAAKVEAPKSRLEFTGPNIAVPELEPMLPKKVDERTALIRKTARNLYRYAADVTTRPPAEFVKETLYLRQLMTSDTKAGKLVMNKNARETAVLLATSIVDTSGMVKPGTFEQMQRTTGRLTGFHNPTLEKQLPRVRPEDAGIRNTARVLSAIAESPVALENIDPKVRESVRQIRETPAAGKIKTILAETKAVIEEKPEAKTVKGLAKLAEFAKSDEGTFKPGALIRNIKEIFRPEEGAVAEIAKKYFKTKEFEELHPVPKDAEIYHNPKHTESVANMTYFFALKDEYTLQDKTLFKTPEKKAKFLSEVAVLHDIDPTRKAGEQARVGATLVWMETPEAQQIMKKRFGWNEEFTAMAKAIIQRTDFPFDESKVGEKTVMGKMREKIPVYENDPKLGPVASKKISDYYDNESPAQKYRAQLSQLRPEAREVVLRWGARMSEYSDKSSTYFENPDYTLTAVKGLGNEYHMDMLPGSSGFLKTIGQEKSFALDVKIAGEFGLKIKYPTMGEVSNLLPEQMRNNWRANKEMFRQIAEKVGPEDALRNARELAVKPEALAAAENKPIEFQNAVRQIANAKLGGDVLVVERVHGYVTEVFDFAEKQFANLMLEGKIKALEMTTYLLDAKGVGQINKMFGMLPGDVKLRVLDKIISHSVKGTLKEGEQAILMHVGGDEYRLNLVGKKLSAKIDKFDAAMKKANEDFAQLMRTTPDDAVKKLLDMGVSESDAKMAVGYAKNMRHPEIPFGFKLMRSEVTSVTTETISGSIMRTIQNAEEKNQTCFQKGVQHILGLEGKNAAQIEMPKTPMLGENEITTGHAFRIDMSIMDDVARTIIKEKLIPGAEVEGVDIAGSRKGFAEAERNLIRNRGGNTFWGENAQNYLGTLINKTVDEHVKETGIKLKYAGDFQFIAETSMTEREFAALKSRIDSTFKSEGIKLNAKITETQIYKPAKAAEIDAKLTAVQLGRAELTAQSLRCADTLISVFEGGRPQLIGYYLSGFNPAELKTMQDVMTYIRNIPEMRNPNIRDFDAHLSMTIKRLGEKSVTGEKLIKMRDDFFNIISKPENVDKIAKLKEKVPDNLEKISKISPTSVVSEVKVADREAAELAEFMRKTKELNITPVTPESPRLKGKSFQNLNKAGEKPVEEFDLGQDAELQKVVGELNKPEVKIKTGSPPEEARRLSYANVLAENDLAVRENITDIRRRHSSESNPNGANEFERSGMMLRKPNTSREGITNLADDPVLTAIVFKGHLESKLEKFEEGAYSVKIGELGYDGSGQKGAYPTMAVLEKGGERKTAYYFVKDTPGEAGEVGSTLVREILGVTAPKTRAFEFTGAYGENFQFEISRNIKEMPMKVFDEAGKVTETKISQECALKAILDPKNSGIANAVNKNPAVFEYSVGYALEKLKQAGYSDAHGENLRVLASEDHRPGIGVIDLDQTLAYKAKIKEGKPDFSSFTGQWALKMDGNIEIFEKFGLDRKTILEKLNDQSSMLYKGIKAAHEHSTNPTETQKFEEFVRSNTGKRIGLGIPNRGGVTSMKINFEEIPIDRNAQDLRYTLTPERAQRAIDARNELNKAYTDPVDFWKEVLTKGRAQAPKL
ncbi:MAG: hypothetical protein V1492_02830 [Candidatus Micrarchaeota archaeon]